jgi:hypothetical protein
MTLAQLQYQGEPLGEVKERVFKVSEKPKYEYEGFSYIKINDSGAGYLVPISRIGLTRNAVLTHGGLTPEEVMIPFVTLTSKLAHPCIAPLELRILNERCQRFAAKTWQIEIELVASTTVNNIQIKFEEPFVAYEKVDTIRENKSQKMLVNFSSTCEQSGLIEIGLRLNFEKNGVQTYLQATDNDTGTGYTANYLVNDQDQYTRLNVFRGIIGAGPNDHPVTLLNKFLAQVKSGKITSDKFNFSAISSPTPGISQKNNMEQATEVRKLLYLSIFVDGKHTHNIEELFSNFGVVKNGNVYVSFDLLAQFNLTAKDLNKKYYFLKMTPK